jgi:putative peptide zinc metalloprotease protein
MDTTIDIASKVQIFTLKDVDGEKLVVYNNNCYHIGDMLFDCLVQLKNGNSFKDIVLTCKKKYGYEGDDIQENVSQAVDAIANSSVKDQVSFVDRIYLKIRLFKENFIAEVAKRIQFLFNKRIMAGVIIAFILSSVLVCSRYMSCLDQTLHFGVARWANLIATNYLSLLIIAFFHEFGHATASYRCGIRPKEIGFGIYMVFPVFYTDVSKIWNISKNKRLLVNVGGIYFQMVLALLLTVMLFLSENPEYRFLLMSVIVMNLFMLAYSLFPFFRNDGYWVYSDFFKIDNLSYNSKQFPKVFFCIMTNKMMPWKEKMKILKADLPLLLYSIFDFSFSTMMYASIIIFTVINISAILQFVEFREYMETSFVIREVITLSISLAINSFFLYRIFRYMLVSLKNKFLL